MGYLLRFFAIFAQNAGETRKLAGGFFGDAGNGDVRLQLVGIKKDRTKDF